MIFAAGTGTRSSPPPPRSCAGAGGGQVVLNTRWTAPTAEGTDATRYLPLTFDEAFVKNLR